MKKIYEKPIVAKTQLMAKATVLQFGSPTPPPLDPDNPVPSGGGGD